LVSLESYGLGDLAWKRADALEALNALMAEEVGALGGDVDLKPKKRSKAI